MTKSLLACLALLFFLKTELAAQHDPHDKISKKLLEKMAKSGPQDFLVLFAAQADVSDASQIADWNARGQYVFQTLKGLADATQVNALNLCRAFDAPSYSYFIVNMISTKGDLRLAQALSELPEVMELVENQAFHVEKPLDPWYEDGHESNSYGRTVETIEWGLTKIKADSVWSQGYRGNGITVGGADTGYKWDHPAIKKAYRGWNNTNQTVNHDYNWHDAIHAIDPHNSGSNPCGLNSNVPCDDDQHGTHTMGTMVGLDSLESDATKIQRIGVAPDAKWIGCRNMERGWGMPSTYSECFQWFLAPTKVDGSTPDPSKRPMVINNSWGCPPEEGCNTAIGSTHWIIKTSLENLRNAGTVVVASAGNSGSNCHTVSEPPAMYAAAFAVGASNSSDGMASFSSRGKVTVDSSNRLKPQISAPGVSVRSCVPPSGFATFSGTSMAGPHVVGAVALILNAKPSLIGNVTSVENLLQNSAKNISATVTPQTCDGIPYTAIPNPIFGYGRLDVKKAVAQALPVELVSFFGKQEKNTVRLTWLTATELMNSHFIVEKSADGQTWESLGRVEGHGTTNESHRYQLVDNQPVSGLNYYRLQQVDFDGRTDFSPVIVVELFKNSTIRAWPNPVGDELTLAFSAEKNADAQLFISNANGQLLSKTDLPVVRGSLTYRLSVAGLPDGIYFLRLEDENGRVIGSGRFVKDERP